MLKVARSRTSKRRERIFLSSHQVLFLILRGDKRPPKEKLGHSEGKGIQSMIFIGSR